MKSGSGPQMRYKLLITSKAEAATNAQRDADVICQTCCVVYLSNNPEYAASSKNSAFEHAHNAQT